MLLVQTHHRNQCYQNNHRYQYQNTLRFHYIPTINIPTIFSSTAINVIAARLRIESPASTAIFIAILHAETVVARALLTTCVPSNTGLEVRADDDKKYDGGSDADDAEDECDNKIGLFDDRFGVIPVH